MKKLNQLSGMPQMGAAFTGWMSKLTLVQIVQTVGGSGFISDQQKQITFQGVIQPLSPRTIALKPEGERAWEWLQIHALAGTLNLKTHDKIIIDDKRYKVMAVLDYSRNNYIEYHAVGDYQ